MPVCVYTLNQAICTSYSVCSKLPARQECEQPDHMALWILGTHVAQLHFIDPITGWSRLLCKASQMPQIPVVCSIVGGSSHCRMGGPL